MKKLSFLFFVCGLLFAISFASAQVRRPVESSVPDLDSYYKIDIAELPKEQAFPEKKMDPLFFKDKLIVLYNNLVIPEIVNGRIVANSQEDQYQTKKTLQDIQVLNKLYKQSLSSGQFVVIAFGFISDANEESELNFLKKVAHFPIYESVVSRGLGPYHSEMVDRNDLFLVDPSGKIIACYKDANQCLQGLKRFIPVAENFKRIKNSPVQHPLDSLNLSLKEIGLLAAFEPGKPWLESYKKLDVAIVKMSDLSRKELMINIKTAIDSYILKTVPEICESAQTHPATNLEKLVLLSRSLRGMPGEDNVKKTLSSIQADKNVTELAKIISSINKFKAAAKSSKGLQKRAEPLIASLKKTIDNPDVTKEIKAEAIETLEQLVEFFPEDEVPVELNKYLYSVKIKANNESSEQTDDDIADSEDDVPRRMDNADIKTGNYPGKRIVRKINGVEIAFRYCPPGSFMMGSPEDEKGRDKEEKQHKVTLTKGFWISETEITQKQFKAVFVDFKGFRHYEYKSEEARNALFDIFEAHDGSFSIDDLTPEEKKIYDNAHVLLEDYPTTDITWSSCQSFCKKCKGFGLPVELPTEAQWEYACRAGSEGPYAEGLNGGQAGDIVYKGAGVDKKLINAIKRRLIEDRMMSDLDELNVDEPGRIRCDELQFEEKIIYAVGKTTPNKWGIYDMHGNADEWCADLYEPYKDVNKTAINPANVMKFDDDSEADNFQHVIRGGRSAQRFSWDVDHMDSIRVGFRVVLVVP